MESDGEPAAAVAAEASRNSAGQMRFSGFAPSTAIVRSAYGIRGRDGLHVWRGWHGIGIGDATTAARDVSTRTGLTTLSTVVL